MNYAEHYEIHWKGESTSGVLKFDDYGTANDIMTKIRHNHGDYNHIKHAVMFRKSSVIIGSVSR